MGETRANVGAKLDASTVAKIDRLAEQFAPFIEGRSHAIRILLEMAFTAMDSGILPSTPQGIHDFLQAARLRKK